MAGIAEVSLTQFWVCLICVVSPYSNGAVQIRVGLEFAEVYLFPTSMPNMTGRPGYRTMEMNGGSSAQYLARTPCVPLLCTLFSRGGNRRVFRLPGAGGDQFHCTVGSSPGHIRCHLCYEFGQTVRARILKKNNLT